jgi:hypothetical protein
MIYKQLAMEKSFKWCKGERTSSETKSPAAQNSTRKAPHVINSMTSWPDTGHRLKESPERIVAKTEIAPPLRVQCGELAATTCSAAAAWHFRKHFTGSKKMPY